MPADLASLQTEIVPSAMTGRKASAKCLLPYQSMDTTGKVTVARVAGNRTLACEALGVGVQ